MKKTPTEEQPTDAWAEALVAFDRDLRRRGAAEKTRRAYAIDLGQFARWASGRGLGPGGGGPPPLGHTPPPRPPPAPPPAPAPARSPRLGPFSGPRPHTARPGPNPA